MNNKINLNDIIETNLNFDITCFNSFSFDNNAKLEKKDTCIVYYSDYTFEGLINNYSKKLESATTSLIYGKIIDNNFLVYVEFGNNYINPCIYVIGKSNYDWVGAKYMCNFSYNYSEIIETPQSFVKHLFISDEEKNDETNYLNYISEKFSYQLLDRKIKDIYNYYTNNFDKEVVKALSLLKNQLNDRFVETINSMQSSINASNYEDVDSSYMHLLSGCDNWLPLRNSFNYLLNLDDLKNKTKKY